MLIISTVFTVFDGHGGDWAAEYSIKNLHSYIVKQQAFRSKEREQALVQAFMECDSSLLQIQRSEGATGGTTAVVCLVDHDAIYTANVGDSRALLYRRSRAPVLGASSSSSASTYEIVELTHDHRPGDAEERQRIVGAGGQCGDDGYACLDDHALAVSRALGNPVFKANKQLSPHEQVVIADPHIHRINRSCDDQFLLIASDGLWNFCDNRTACEFVARRLKKSPDLEEAANELIQFALTRNSSDNITVLIVVFEWSPEDKTKHEKLVRSGKSSFQPLVSVDSRSLRSSSSRRLPVSPTNAVSSQSSPSQAEQELPIDHDTIRINPKSESQLNSLFDQP